MFAIRHGFILIFALLISGFGRAQFYTGSYQEFGKNRVQYKGQQWKFHNYKQFKAYFYSGGENHAIFAAQSAYKHLQELQKLFDYYLDEKIELLVFNRQSDFKMSNVGITTDEASNIGGVTKIVGSKVFLYYEGDHDKFDEQIRAGIAQVLVNKMMYGEDWKDALKSSTLLSLPSWYINGFINYIGSGWNTEIDSRVKDGILSGRYTQFNKLEGIDADYAGHSLWNYIAERYGMKVIPQIFYMARISRNVESGFLFVLGVNLNTLANEYINYYRARYATDSKAQNEIEVPTIPIKKKRKTIITQFKVNPAGTHAAYVTNELGQYKIWIYNISTGKTKRILKKDYKLDRISDYSFPVIEWHPTIDALGYFHELKGSLLYSIYTMEDGKTNSVPILQMEKVLSFDYNDDGTKIVFSGVNQGKTDLYLFKITGRSKTQLTDDIYDDMDPQFVDNSTRVIFSSNRFSDTLTNKMDEANYKPWDSDYDVFIYDLGEKPLRQVLQRLTNTDDANERNPHAHLKGNFTYLSDRNGIYNRFVAAYDSAIAYIDTAIHYRYFATEYPVSNFNYNAKHYDVQLDNDFYTFLTFENGKFNLHKGSLSADQFLTEEDLELTKYMTSLKPSTYKPKSSSDVIKIKDDGEQNEIDIEHYQFEDDTPEFEEKVKTLDEETNISKEEEKINKKVKQKEEPPYEVPRVQLYKTNFATDYVVSQFDNQFLFMSYQRYAGPGAVYFNPGLNGLIKLGVSDLFENHKIMGGFRIPANFESGEYLLTYDNLAGRIDHKYILYRNSFGAIDQFFRPLKVITHEAKYRANYPIDEVQSLRFTAGYRLDRTIIQAVDENSLNTDDEFFNMASGKLEYVFDVVRPKGLNLYNGTRFKLFAEMYREFDQDQANIFIVGADFRHYQKIHKDIIYAGRFASSYSFGDKKLVYYLGGVDNWIFRREPSFDQSIQVPQTETFAFQTIATPMRGFIQNIRNGSNFAVINNEIRIPIVKYLANKPLKSDFLENFMVVGFSDIGTAWTGIHPYSEENAFNTIVIDEPDIFHIEIENQKDPIVYGYGFGIRSKLFGYYVKFDWAWGVDDGQRLESIRYLSLALDF